MSNPDLNSTLELIIFPTEKCNFRCTYCYEDFEIGKMRASVVNGVKNLIKKRVELGTKELKLSWFGGEPLLAKDVILDISKFANGFKDDGRLNYFHGDFTTNAYVLDADLLAKLVSLRQRVFQISLDGYGAAHDVTRKYASGKGTFDVIWSNLLAAAKTNLDFHMLLRVHITNTNIGNIDELVGYIVRCFRNDKRFSVMFRRVEDFGGENGEAVIVADFDAASRAAKRLVKFLSESGITAHDAVSAGDFESQVGAMMSGDTSDNNSLNENGDNPRSLAGGYICYAAKPNSLIIRADGRISKCTVRLNDSVNSVGVISEDGKLVLDGDRMNFWTRGFVSGDPIQLGCPARH